jgi:sortase A
MTQGAAVWTERALLGGGALLLAGWAAVMVEARIYGWQQEHRLERMIEEPRRAPSRRPRPPARRVHPMVASEDLVGRIEIPRLGVKAIVAEGVSGRTLRRAVGHLPGTALPGADGNVVLAAHRDTFFRPLKDVQRGDAIALTTPEGRFEYTVRQTQVVEPSRTDVLEPADGPTLTLVTCYPFYLVGSAPDRFIVRAVRTSSSR